jgi:AraC-like DNA-binding protein
MNTIVIIGIVQCVFLTFLVLSKSETNLKDNWLAVFLIFNALHLVFFYANFNTEYLEYQNILIAGSGFPLLIGPLFFIYVYKLVKKQSLKFNWLVIHFVPYLIFCLGFYYLWIQNDMADMLVFDGFIHPYRNVAWPLANITIFFAISAGVYPIWTLLLLRQHTKNLYNEFSYIEKINLDWVRNWIVFSIISFILVFFVILIVVDSSLLIDHSIAFKFIAIVITTQAFFVGYFGFKQTTIFSNIKLENTYSVDEVENKDTIIKYKGSKLAASIANDYMENLSKKMKNDKPFLNGNLSINMLSELTSIPMHHLSQILNDQLGKNFFDFVNEYRVEEIKRQMMDSNNNNITLLGLAYDCGFNSKSSFNSTFKRITGKTPSEYKRQNR